LEERADRSIDSTIGITAPHPMLKMLATLLRPESICESRAQSGPRPAVADAIWNSRDENGAAVPRQRRHAIREQAKCPGF
jgi:hypothetical protein